MNRRDFLQRQFALLGGLLLPYEATKSFFTLGNGLWTPGNNVLTVTTADHMPVWCEGHFIADFRRGDRLQITPQDPMNPVGDAVVRGFGDGETMFRMPWSEVIGEVCIEISPPDRKVTRSLPDPHWQNTLRSESQKIANVPWVSWNKRHRDPVTP